MFFHFDRSYLKFLERGMSWLDKVKEKIFAVSLTWSSVYGLHSASPRIV